jgi:RNA polymerase sigma-70 factor (ECF subfamily)
MPRYRRSSTATKPRVARSSAARKDLANDRRRFQPSPAEHRRILLGFMQAASEGDMHLLTDVLSEDVVLWADGRGKVRGAATRAIHGRDAVAAFLISSRRFVSEPETRFDFATINGSQGLILRESDKPLVVMTFEIEDGRICVVRLLANPDKLTRVDR